MTRHERILVVVTALGGGESWVKTEAARSAAHMDDYECKTILHALIEAGQLETTPGMVKLAAAVRSAD